MNWKVISKRKDGTVTKEEVFSTMTAAEDRRKEILGNLSGGSYNYTDNSLDQWEIEIERADAMTRDEFIELVVLFNAGEKFDLTDKQKEILIMAYNEMERFSDPKADDWSEEGKNHAFVYFNEFVQAGN